MESRGKTPEKKQEKQLLRNHLDIIKVQPSDKKYNGIMHKNDLQFYFDEKMEKTNAKSMDYNNKEIIQFCTYLFHTWLEDYKEYA